MNIKKSYYFVLMFMLSVIVVGCKNIGQYALSEQTVNKALQQKISQYNQNINASDLFKMDLSFNDLNLDIGREVANKVVADGTAKANIQTPLGKQNISLKLNIKALPEFNQDQNAIFLKDVEIMDYSLNSSLGSVSNKVFLPYLNQALQLYFKNNPIYQLDKTNQLEYLAFKSAAYMKVDQGKFVFSL